MTSRMREAALNYGCNARQWPEAEQRAAVAEMFQDDEREEYSNWIGDCLAELIASDVFKRLELIALMGEINTNRRLFSMGAMLDNALREFPLDSISELCELHIHDWRLGERLSADRLNADGMNKAAMEGA